MSQSAIYLLSFPFCEMQVILGLNLMDGSGDALSSEFTYKAFLGPAHGT